MAFTVEDVVARLEDAGVRLDRGLTEADVKRVEKKFGFAFGPEHRDLLRRALPLGDAWLNWRHATPAKVRERLQAPIEQAVAAILGSGAWVDSWGPRPADARTAEQVARRHLAAAPTLVPLYGQRYLPAAPAPAGSGVFSVTSTEISVCAVDLPAYVEVEFGSAEPPATAPAGLPRLEIWSELAAIHL